MTTPDEPFFTAENILTWLEYYTPPATEEKAKTFADFLNARVQPLLDRIAELETKVFELESLPQNLNPKLARPEGWMSPDGKTIEEWWRAAIYHESESNKLRKALTVAREALEYADGCIKGTIRDYKDELPKKLSAALAKIDGVGK